MTIYDRIKELAKRRRISIRELEATLKFSNGTVSKWKKDAPEKKLDQVAGFFNTTTAYLRGHDDTNRLMALLQNNKATESKSDEIDPTTARKINNEFGKVIRDQHVIPPYMALVADEVSTFPIIGTIQAGPNGIAYQDFQGSLSTTNVGLTHGKKYFYLKVSGDSMTGDGIHDGDFALIEQQDYIDDPDAIYAVIYDGESGTLKRVTKTDTAIVLTPSNPAVKPIIIPASECDEFFIVGKLRQVTKMF